MHQFDSVSFIALRDEYLSRKDRDKDKNLPEEDPDFFLKRVFREYSKTYHTPLHLVEELPLLDVLEAYYAENYSQASDEALEDLIRKVSLSKEDQKKADIIKDRMDALDFEDIGESLAENAAKKLEKGIPKIKDALQEMVRQARGVSREQEMVPSSRGRGSLPAKVPPAIKMTFVSQEEMAKLLDDGDELDIFPKAKP